MSKLQGFYVAKRPEMTASGRHKRQGGTGSDPAPVEHGKDRGSTQISGKIRGTDREKNGGKRDIGEPEINGLGSVECSDEGCITEDGDKANDHQLG